MKLIAELLRSTRAATAVEYGLIVAMIFVAALATIGEVGRETTDMWQHIGSEVEKAMGD